MRKAGLEQMRPTRTALSLMLTALVITLAACGGGSGSSISKTTADTDPPEVQLGERLFLETRFAQFFFANSSGQVNQPLVSGDPVVNSVRTTSAPLPGPFAGQSMNCRSCHLVDELQDDAGGGVRTYCDFARQSPISARSDGLTATPRNSPPLVNATLARNIPPLFHFDGEFASVDDLIVKTLTGRNFGWLPDESAIAVEQIARVIRDDDGKNELAKSFGGGGISYATLLLATDPSIPKRLVLPPQFRLDVSTASDDDILNEVVALIDAYVDQLRFSTDDDGLYNSSPYDVFLIKNGLPRSPDPGESEIAYSQRLLAAIDQLSDPVFVTPKDGKFEFHNGQPFQFGAAELAGLKIFFTQPATPEAPHSGNCIACHAPPNFTDFKMHNTGASQVEYDGIFGNGGFAAISVPNLVDRNANFDLYLPPSPAHPNASGRFRTAAISTKPGFTDLGAWNIVGNPDIPNPQQALSEVLCAELNLTGADCNPDTLLPLALGYFKTPTLRDLGQSNPYLHSGAMTTVEDVINFYVTVSELDHNSQLRNGSIELSSMFIDADDVGPLTAFLNALNEDYN